MHYPTNLTENNVHSNDKHPVWMHMRRVKLLIWVKVLLHTTQPNSLSPTWKRIWSVELYFWTDILLHTPHPDQFCLVWIRISVVKQIYGKYHISYYIFKIHFSCMDVSDVYITGLTVISSEYFTTYCTSKRLFSVTDSYMYDWYIIAGLVVMNLANKDVPFPVWERIGFFGPSR